MFLKWEAIRSAKRKREREKDKVQLQTIKSSRSKSKKTNILGVSTLVPVSKGLRETEGEKKVLEAIKRASDGNKLKCHDTYVRCRFKTSSSFRLHPMYD